MTPKASRLVLTIALIALPFSALAAPSCFQRKTDTLESYITMDLPADGADGAVSGSATGVIQDDAQSYYTSWQSTFTGERKGKDLKLSVETKIEDDDQKQDAVWTIEGANVLMDGDAYEPVDCKVVEEKAADQ